MAVLYAGCGGASDAASRSMASDAPLVTATSPAAEVQEASGGAVSFAVDARAKHFASVPADQNNYTPLASTITARAADGSDEQLTITFLSMDLKKLEYPVELPRPKAAGPSLDPLAAMASVGFSYRDEAGREWAGPGRVRVETFGRDGVIIGTFPEVSLPHTGKKLPNVTLAAGEFRARVSPPW